MNWNEAIGDYLTYLSAGGAPKSSMTTRRQHLQLAAKYLGEDPWAVTSASLVAWFGSLTVAQETRRSRRTTMRNFYGWAHTEGHVGSNVALALPKVKASPPNPRPLPRIRYETALSRAGARERLMLRMGWELALRRGEIAVGHSDDLMEDLEGYSLLVHGKGGKQRIVPLPKDLARDLRALGAGYFFPGRIEGHLSPRWVGRILTDLIPGDVWTTHTLRHAALTRWWHHPDSDPIDVQDLAGHASLDTTRAYVKKDGTKARRLVESAA